MRGILCIFLILYAQESFSGFTVETFVCPQNNLVYKGVTCCLDSISENICKEKIDRLLSESDLAAVQVVRSNYDLGVYEYGGVPNCFWNVLRVSDYIRENEFKVYESSQFEQIIKTKGKFLENLTEAGDLNLDDILVFKMSGQIRVVDEGRPMWFPFEQVSHAAIYLGEGMIFQKEDVGSKAFSIDSIEHSLSVYTGAIRPPLRGVMKLQLVKRGLSSKSYH